MRNLHNAACTSLPMNCPGPREVQLLSRGGIIQETDIRSPGVRIAVFKKASLGLAGKTRRQENGKGEKGPMEERKSRMSIRCGGCDCQVYLTDCPQ